MVTTTSDLLRCPVLVFLSTTATQAQDVLEQDHLELVYEQS
jgi:hypothetical protein